MEKKDVITYNNVLCNLLKGVYIKDFSSAFNIFTLFGFVLAETCRVNLFLSMYNNGIHVKI